MRRPLIILPALAALSLLGCEDGPDQTYSPSPPGAGNIWNSGNPAQAVADAGQSFDAGYPSTGKLELCSTDFKRQRWAWMLTQPVAPPRFYAGIDMALDNNWDGLTIDAAEHPPLVVDGGTGFTDPTCVPTPTKPCANNGLCQSNAFGFEGTCPSGFGGCDQNSWGNNNEVIFNWNVATHIVDQMELQLGYTGPFETNAYPDHQGNMHTYKITPGDVVRRDEQPWEIQWQTFPSLALDTQITDMFNAAMATFAPNAGVPFDQGPVTGCSSDTDCNAPGIVESCMCTHVLDKMGNPTPACATPATSKCGLTNCGVDGNCLVYNVGGTTIFGFRPLVIYVEGNGGIPQPALSQPQLIYNFFSKWMPYSYLPQVLKLDAEGPVSRGSPIGLPPGSTTVCSQQIGQTFTQLVQDCVQVHTRTPGTTPDTDPVDVVNLNKITHSLTHDQEHWTANVLGVNQNFTSAAVTLNPNTVVLDSTEPSQGPPTSAYPDVAQDFTFDVRARGDDVNDSSTGTDIYTPGSLVSLSGSAMVMIEWAHLMLTDIARILNLPAPKLIGDPTCIGFGATGEPNYIGSNAPVSIDGGPPQQNPNYGCSGIEGLIIPNGAATFGPGGQQVDFSGDPALKLTPAPTDINPTSNYDTAGFYAQILKPGDLNGALCIDPGAYTDCDANAYSVFENALLHVTRVLGGGVLTNLPTELQDRRYYFQWFGIAYIKYLKAFGTYANQYPKTVTNFPTGTAGTGLSPSVVRNTQIDLESLFFDYELSPGQGGAQTFDKFEYIDRDYIGKGNNSIAGINDNFIPWDFEYGCDLFGGNQRYDNWYRRMDREELAMYASMLVSKSDTPGLENNVNITNLFGSQILGGNLAANTSGVWPSWACAVGLAGDPLMNCGAKNPPLDPTNPSGAPPCGTPGGMGPGGTTLNASGCPGTQVCAVGVSFENGVVSACGDACNFPAPSTATAQSTPNYPALAKALSGCSSPSQTCAALGGELGPPYAEGCLDMKMDKNSGQPNANPLLWEYPGAWAQTPFARGHSPIAIPTSGQQPDIGVAQAQIPNFAVNTSSLLSPYTSGPYTVSPALAAAPTTCATDSDCATTSCNPSTKTCLPCAMGFTQSANQVWCNAATVATASCGANCNPATTGFYTPLVPWLGPQNDYVGFSIPLDAQHNQFIAGGQLDFTGVLETYIVDYVPYIDQAHPSCVASADAGAPTSGCNPGFECDQNSGNCYTTDGTIQVTGIEGADFLGQAFVCQDPATSDILHVGMYDSAISIIQWFENHPGSQQYGVVPSAEEACGVLFIRSPADNYIDYIVSKTWGVTLNMGGGQGLGRVTDIVLWDPGLVQSL